MERKYCLKLDGRLAGHYEIFTEDEITYLRNRFIEVRGPLLAIEDFETLHVIDKLVKVLEIRTLQDFLREAVCIKKNE